MSPNVRCSDSWTRVNASSRISFAIMKVSSVACAFKSFKPFNPPDRVRGPFKTLKTRRRFNCQAKHRAVQSRSRPDCVEGFKVQGSRSTLQAERIKRVYTSRPPLSKARSEATTSELKSRMQL